MTKPISAKVPKKVFFLRPEAPTRAAPSAQPKTDAMVAAATKKSPLGAESLPADVASMRALAKSAPLQSIDAFKVNDYTTLTGTLYEKRIRGIGEEKEPGGHWLVLDAPIRIGDKEVKELYIDLDGPAGCGVGGGSQCGACSLAGACSGKTGNPTGPEGRITLNGRLDRYDFGGVEMPPSTYFAISGVSNPDRGEPRYDGKTFSSTFTGKPLDVLTVADQAKEDWPDNIVVLDLDQRMAHVGNIGGALPEGTNPFNAYVAQRPIEFAGTADKSALVFDGKGRPSTSESKKPLDSVTTDRDGRMWWFDRDARKLYGVKDGSVQRVIKLEKGDFLGEERDTPYGVWRGVDGRGKEVATPRDQWVVAEKEVIIPRRMDPDTMGTSLVKDTPAVFADLASKPDDSIPVDAFYAALEARMTETPEGVEMLKQIELTIIQAEDLYRKGMAAKPPLDKDVWRRSMIQSYLHSKDLGVVMNALGYDATGCAGKHDMNELVPATDLKWQLKRKFYEPWMEKYISSLPDDAQVNISYLNPAFASSMFKWGDSRQDANGLMDPHRLAPHHNGNSREDVTWVEKALNFLSHHMPREHMGIRHQQRGDWSNLEHALSTDPAIKNSEIGKAIARDAAKVWQQLEAEGKVVPWQKLKVPEGVETPKLERSYEVVQGMNAAGDKLYATNLKAARASLEHASPALRGAAAALISEMETLPTSGSVASTKMLEQLLAAAAKGSDADKAVATALGNALAARYAQRAPLSREAMQKFMPQLAAVEAMLQKPKSDFFAADELNSAISDMEQLEHFAKLAEQGQDKSTAVTLREWSRLWREGLVSVSVSR